MKVLISGAFSTGKSSLVSAIARDRHLVALFEGHVIVREDIARSCPLPIVHNETMNTSMWLAGAVLSRESELNEGGADLLIVCDRGLPDILSHSLALADSSSAELRALTALASEWMATYDAVFVTRPDANIPVEDDGLRAVDDEYRAIMDYKLMSVLSQVRASYVELPMSGEGRISLVREWIQSSYPSARRPQ